jgi:hypothetical protein
MSNHDHCARTGGVFHDSPDGSQAPINFRPESRPAIGNATCLGHDLPLFKHRLDVVLIDLEDPDTERLQSLSVF